MVNPFLSHYADGNLIVKTNSKNLFWLLVLMLATGLMILGAAFFDTAFLKSSVPFIVLGFLGGVLFSLLLLTLGYLQFASWVTFAGFLSVVTAVSVLSRSGTGQMDFSQATVFFFLGLVVMASVGVGGILTSVWVVAGVGVMAWLWFVPATYSNMRMTLGEWDKAFNPLISLVLYLAGGLSGTFLLVQGRRNLKMMQWDQEIIETTNQMLEQTVEDRTKALQTILDASGQGLFTIGGDFLVESDYSHGCRIIYGKDIGGLDADKLLFPQSDLAREFRQGLGLYFQGKSKASVIFDLLEKETFIRGRFLTIGYKEAGPGKILVVLTDVTLDRQLADRNRADEARRNLIMRALGHKRFFAGLLADAENLFGTLRIYEDRAATADEARNLLASIHTFKGNCGFFGFTLSQEVAHDFEYAISDSLVLGEDLDFHDLSLDLKKAYYQELGVIIEVMGRDWLDEAGGIIIPREVYEKVSKYVAGKYPKETHLVDVLEHFRKMPMKDLFSRFPFVAQATAEKLGKKVAPMEIIGGDLRIVPERLEGLISACIHIVNNMVDHGIELPYIREAQGKSPEGHLTLNLIRESGSAVIQFIDDGQGISLPEVEIRAKSLGLFAPDSSPTAPELLQVLFAPGFSTRTEATEISGRGIGLAAVRQEAERLGGRVEVQSKLNSGTTFEIILPLGVFANRRTNGPVPEKDRRKA